METRLSAHRSKRPGVAPLDPAKTAKETRSSGVRHRRPRSRHAGPGVQRARETLRLRCPTWLCDLAHWIMESTLGPPGHRALQLLKATVCIVLLGVLSQHHLGLPCFLLSLSCWLFRGVMRRARRWLLPPPEGSRHPEAGLRDGTLPAAGPVMENTASPPCTGTELEL